MSWEHDYLKSAFPQYDYNNPTKPWEIHTRDSDGIRNCAWQMKSFHYWWIVEQCEKTGEIGLSINIDNLPFCFHVDNREDNGHIFVHHNSIYKQFNREKFPLIVASALIPYSPCVSGVPKCDGTEVAKEIDKLASLLKPSGVLIAAILDETGPRNEGRSLKESSGFQHAWTASQFERTVLKEIKDDLWNVDEFDTFKSDMSFNLVLRKR